MNKQGWDITVMTGNPRDEFVSLMREKLAGRIGLRETGQSLDSEFFVDLGGAPVVIAVTVFKYADENAAMSSLQSGAALMQNLVLAAQAERLRTCWITEARYIEEELLSFLDKKDRQLLAITPVGYPAEETGTIDLAKPEVKWIGFD